MAAGRGSRQSLPLIMIKKHWFHRKLQLTHTEEVLCQRKGSERQQPQAQAVGQFYFFNDIM